MSHEKIISLVVLATLVIGYQINQKFFLQSAHGFASESCFEEHPVGAPAWFPPKARWRAEGEENLIAGIIRQLTDWF